MCYAKNNFCRNVGKVDIKSERSLHMKTLIFTFEYRQKSVHYLTDICTHRKRKSFAFSFLTAKENSNN